MNPFAKGKTTSRTSNATVTENEVRALRRLAREGTSVKELAEMYMLGLETVRRILRRETWRWVTEEVELSVPEGPISEEMARRAKDSEEKFLRMLQGIPQEATGLEKLQQLAVREVEKVERVDQMLEEVADLPPGFTTKYY